MLGAWYFKLDNSLTDLGLIRSNHEPAMYYINDKSSKICVGVFVDDLLMENYFKT